MQASTWRHPDTWKYAVLMPYICHDTKHILMGPFVKEDFRRIGQLRADMARLDYV